MAPWAPSPTTSGIPPTGSGGAAPAPGGAELAPCLLIAVLGSQARCPARDSSGKCGRRALRCCEKGILVAPATYQAFSSRNVATWPEGSEWRITAEAGPCVAHGRPRRPQRTGGSS